MGGEGAIFDMDEAMQPEWRSNFEQLFNAPEAKEMWAPFVDIELRAQEQLLEQLAGAQETAHGNSAASSFSQISRRLRDQLKKVVDSEALAEIEVKIRDFHAAVAAGSENSTRICGSSGYHRMLIHGCAQYYGLVSKS